MRLMTRGTQPIARRDDAITWRLHPALHASSHDVALVVEVFFAYTGLGALFLKASLHQDMYLIKACTLVAVCTARTGQAEGARAVFLRLRGAPYTAPSKSHHTVGGR